MAKQGTHAEYVAVTQDEVGKFYGKLNKYTGPFFTSVGLVSWMVSQGPTHLYYDRGGGFD